MSKPLQTNYRSYSNRSCSRLHFHRIGINWQKPVPHFPSDLLDPPLRGALRSPHPNLGIHPPSPSSPPPPPLPFSRTPQGTLPPLLRPDAAMQGLTWWRGAPEALTHEGSLWGLQGGVGGRREARRGEAEAEVPCGKEGKRLRTAPAFL